MAAVHEIAGWAGAALLLTGFIWGLRRTDVSCRPAYLLMNIAGALGIIINTYSVGAYPAMTFKEPLFKLVRI